jgi:hypothetical protein
MRGLTYFKTGFWDAKPVADQPCSPNSFTVQTGHVFSPHNLAAGNFFAANLAAAVKRGYYDASSLEKLCLGDDENKIHKTILKRFQIALRLQLEIQDRAAKDSEARLIHKCFRRSARKVAVSTHFNLHLIDRD